MNIIWDNANKEFVAQFEEFAGDLEAVKAAGFRTDGPPGWRWFAPAPGVKALNRLRANKPASGLTISVDALEIYKPLAEIEEKNQAVLDRLKDYKKTLKKAQKEAAKHAPQIPDDKMYISLEDLPPLPPFVSSHLVVEFPGEKLICVSCADRVYFYEYPDIPMCLFCAKTC